MSSNAMRGCVAMVLCAMACFAGLDTLSKLATGSVPVIVVIWARFLVQMAAAGARVWPMRRTGILRSRRPWLQLLRGLSTTLSSLLGLLSLKYLQVADFTAILMLIPMLITAISSTHLKERVPVAGWWLLAGGFVGALVVIRPGAQGFQWGMLLSLGCVAFNTAFQLLTSVIARDDDPQAINFYTGVVATAVFTLGLPFLGAAPSWSMAALLVAAGLCNTVGQYLMILAYARARPSQLTSCLYFQIPFAALAGWMVFGKTPDAWAFVGIVVITACGLMSTETSRNEARRWFGGAVRALAARRIL